MLREAQYYCGATGEINPTLVKAVVFFEENEASGESREENIALALLGINAGLKEKVKELYLGYDKLLGILATKFPRMDLSTARRPYSRTER